MKSRIEVKRNHFDANMSTELSKAKKRNTTKQRNKKANHNPYNILLLTYVSSDLSILVLIASFLQKGSHFFRIPLGPVRRIGLNAEHVELDKGPVDGVEYLHFCTLC